MSKNNDQLPKIQETPMHPWEKRLAEDPRCWSIYLLNNDETHIDVVVAILKYGFFILRTSVAVEIAIEAERNGKALIYHDCNYETAHAFYTFATSISQDWDNGRLKFELVKEEK